MSGQSAILAATALTPPILAGGVAFSSVPRQQPTPQGINDQCRGIIDRLSKLALEQVTAREPIERRWIRDSRAYHGLYDQQTERALMANRQSRAYVRLTRAKTTTLEAKLFDLIHPTDDRNWDIGATAVPKLAKQAREAQLRAQNAGEAANDLEAAQRHDIAGQAIGDGDDQGDLHHAALAEIAKAEKAAEGMRDEMDDQLTESHYPAQSRDVIHQSCMLGTGVLKGPIVGERKRGRWMPQEDGEGGYVEGQFLLEQQNDPRPLIRFVDVWSFFPDMSARRIEECEFTFERHLWSKKDLRRMVKTHAFSANAVRELLRDDRRGPVTAPGLNYLMQLRSITGEGDGAIKNRFIGWEYHGPLECDEVVTLLRAMGEEEMASEYELADDPLEEFNVILFFCDGHLLKIAPDYPMDSGETLYSVFNIEESEGSIFGYGIPHIMSDSQDAANSAWRMALDNGGLSVGPQIVIDKDAIMPADGSWNVTAKKIWYRIKQAVPNAPDPVQFFNVPNNMEEIVALIKTALDFIDMETGLPTPQQGEQGATTQTVGGMSILQNNANVIYRRIVKNYDDGIITPTMRRLYDWNMQHNKRGDIKGDMQVDARGSSVLLVKEVMAQNLLFVVTQLMNNETASTMLKPYDAVRKLFQSMMIKPDEVMVTEDEWKDKVKAIADSQQGQQDPATIQAKARIDAANIAAQAQAIRNDTELMIERIRERTALVALASSHNLSLEELKTKLDVEQLRVDSKERQMATEIGAEAEAAREARARGETPTGSGGFISEGSVPQERAA